MNNLIDECLNRELAYIEKKFPGNEDNLAALMEECGELAQALIEHKRGKDSNEHIFVEAIQVAAMGIKIAEKGCAGFPYQFNFECYSHFFKFRSITNEQS